MQFLHRLKIYSFSFGYTLVRNESSLMKYQNIGKRKYCGTTYIKTGTKSGFCSDDCRRKSIQDNKAQ